MLYAWMGFLKPDADPVPQSVQRLFEHDSREAAESFVMASPYLQADLYADHRLYEFANEVG